MKVVIDRGRGFVLAGVNSLLSPLAMCSWLVYTIGLHKMSRNWSIYSTCIIMN